MYPAFKDLFFQTDMGVCNKGYHEASQKRLKPEMNSTRFTETLNPPDEKRSSIQLIIFEPCRSPSRHSVLTLHYVVRGIKAIYKIL